MAPVASPSGERVVVVIRNPAKSDGHAIEVPLDATLAELQRLISEQYPGHPQPAEQTASGRRRRERPLACWWHVASWPAGAS